MISAEIVCTVKMMNVTKILLLFTALLVASTSFCETENGKTVSGSLTAGYRILAVDPAIKGNTFIVYRGDYVKFRYPQAFAALAFAMPELNYSGTLFSDPGKSPFFKMKDIGTYPFTLGEGGGTISVIDLVLPNYIEVTADEGAELLDNVHPFILDVRTPEEYQQFHVDGSQLIPIQQLQKRVTELEAKKDEDIFIYCATGNRSTVAARILADQGFKRIYNLRYGIFDWARRGYPYEPGK